MRPRGADRHLDAAVVLDYLEQRLGAAARRDVEGHLGRPCAACRERLRELGSIIATMRGDPVPEVPRWLTQRALEVFTPEARPSAIRQGIELVARLLFDSFNAPMPAAARRSVGEARRLQYALGDAELEIEVEREGGSTMTLRGRLHTPDAALWAIRADASGERSDIAPDSFGHFVIEGLPSGVAELRLSGPPGVFLVTGVEP